MKGAVLKLLNFVHNVLFEVIAGSGCGANCRQARKGAQTVKSPREGVSRAARGLVFIFYFLFFVEGSAIHNFLMKVEDYAQPLPIQSMVVKRN